MQECVRYERRQVGWREADAPRPAGTEVANRHQCVLIEEYLQLARTEAELVEERRNVEPNDRPNDDRLMRAADVVSKRKQYGTIGLQQAIRIWERRRSLASSVAGGSS